MKKITLLFATLLAMSGTLLGQNLPKVLLEKDINFYGGLLVLPQSENIGAFQNKDGRIYDKRGEFLRSISFAKYFTSANSQFSVRAFDNYFLVDCSVNSSRGEVLLDSTLYFDKDFKFLGKFGIKQQYSYIKDTRLKPLTDGVAYYDPSTSMLTKYNLQGNVEWQHKNAFKAVSLNSKPPFLLLTDTIPYKNLPQKMVVLGAKGQILNTVEGFSAFYDASITPTSDGGFWLYTNKADSTFSKFDSTGKVTGKVKMPFIKGILGFTKNAIIALPTYSYLYIFQINGERQNVPLGVQYFLDYKVTDDAFLYGGVDSPQYNNNGSVIGLINFDNPKLSFERRLADSQAVHDVKIKEDCIFVVEKSGRRAPYLENFSIYNLDGTLRYQKKLGRVPDNGGFSYSMEGVGNYLYFYRPVLGGSSTTLINYKTGREIWAQDSNRSDYIYVGAVAPNDKAFFVINDCSKGAGNCTQRIEFVKADTIVEWSYSFKNPLRNYQVIKPLKDGGILVLRKEIVDNTGKEANILRKISLCSYNTSSELGAVSGTLQLSANGYDGKDLCPGDKVKLTTAKIEGVVYEWQRDGKMLSSAQGVNFDVNQSGTYKLTVKDTVCLYSGISNEVKVSILTIPVTEIKAPQTAFCEGEKTTISAQTDGTIFQWQKDEKDLPNATKSIFEANVSGNYRVGVRGDKCPQQGYSNVINLNVKPLPEALISTDIKGVIYEPFTVKMTASTGTGLSYQWLKDEVNIANANANVYEANKSGKYKVSVTKDGCIKTSESLSITIQIPLATDGEIGEEAVLVYPNPSRGVFKIVLPKTLKGADIQLFDLMGRERTLNHTSEQTQAEGLPQGTYFLKVNKGERSITNKIVIE